MKPMFVSCVFSSLYHLFTDWITVVPVKKQIALAQGQDQSPGALPASHEFTLNPELAACLLHSLKLPPAMMEGWSGSSLVHHAHPLAPTYPPVLFPLLWPPSGSV